VAATPLSNVALARQAVATVLDPVRSELYGLWLGDGPPPEGHEWIQAVEDLRQRLQR
jgi:hypothetical protein